VSGDLPDVLVRITDAVSERLTLESPPPDLERRAREAAGVRRRGGARSLREALTRPGVRVIAECKRRSPSAGWLRQPFDPVALAGEYQAGGAAAVSVVTEPQFFAGKSGWVPTVRRQVTLPVLQKDFLISPRQIYEAALLGADAVLLIARILPGGALVEALAVAAELDLEVLLEVHDEHDLERALASTNPVLGINARDLRTFTTDPQRALALAADVPADRIVVMESGVRGVGDVRALVARGRRQCLVGEYLLRSADPRAAVEELVACR
jgi:indole-3-glycerol phosphate synthase